VPTIYYVFNFSHKKHRAKNSGIMTFTVEMSLIKRLIRVKRHLLKGDVTVQMSPIKRLNLLQTKWLEK
jgi:hypothetical protein